MPNEPSNLSSLSAQNNRARIFKLLKSPGIDSEESIPPAYVALQRNSLPKSPADGTQPHSDNFG